MRYEATKVRKELSSDRSHEHIQGVCTTGNQHYTRAYVVASINSGDTWVTRSASGNTAVIRPMKYCPGSGCLATPYITTRADNQKDDNLENLPRC